MGIRYIIFKFNATIHLTHKDNFYIIKCNAIEVGNTSCKALSFINFTYNNRLITLFRQMLYASTEHKYMKNIL